MRMCLPSASFQPCRAFSCMVVTRKLPSGEKVMPVCAPAHSQFGGLAVGRGEMQRGAIVAGDAEAHALWRERQALDRARMLELFHLAVGEAHGGILADAVGECALRAGGNEVIHLRPASASWVVAPSAVVATTLPSSPPVSSDLPSSEMAAQSRPSWAVADLVAMVEAMDLAIRPARNAECSPMKAAATQWPSRSSGATVGIRNRRQ
jgi:hypothetical protein